MKVSTFGKATIGLAAAATMGFGLAVPAANAATALTATQEDPTTSTYLGGAAIGANTLVGVGSDTIQDVEYGIGQDLGKQADGTLNFASWTATGATAMSYRSGGAPATPSAHPNGSGPGYTALKESLGISSTGADGVAAGDVNFSRASGFQGTEAANSGSATVAGTGVVTEIPFAIDSISFAAPAGSPFLLTNSGKGLTVQNLSDIYSGVVNEVNTSTGALQKEVTAGTVDSGFLPIQAFLPKAGSGSRQFFLKQLSVVPGTGVSLGTNKGDSWPGAATTAPTPGAPYVGSGMPGTGAPVEEHNATVLSAAGSSVAAIAPFSGAKFVGYGNGVIADPSGKTAGTDYVLVPFDSASGPVLPYTGSAGSYVPNPAYQTQGVEGKATLTREVFNIVATNAIKNPTTTIDNELISTFVGANSSFCKDSATIQKYGFIVDSNCGNISRSADVASTSTLTLSNTPAVAGKSTVFTVNAASNGNGGGTVTLTVNGVVYTGTIPAGQTSVNITVPTKTAGTYTYGNGANDGFVPNLHGVAPSPINPDPTATLTFKVAKTNASVKAYAARVSHQKVGQVKVVVTAPGVAVTGKVTIIVKNSKGTKLIYLPGKNLFHGSVTAKLGKKLKAGKYTVWVSYSGNANINGKAAAKLATLTVY